MHLGDLLLEQKLITKEKLRDALVIQRATGQLIGQVLIDAGYITEETLIKSLLMQKDIIDRR
jgi:hypothetical protein